MANVTDSFNRANSTTTMGTSDSGHVWVPNAGGVWGISSNQAYWVSYVGAACVIDSGLADCSVQVTVTVKGTGDGLCWRSADHDNNFVFEYATANAYRVQAGSYTVVGNGGTWASGDVITVVLVGDSHTIKQNGVTRITYTSSFNQTATKHGLSVYSDTTARFDNFSISALSRIPNAPIIVQAVRRAAIR